MRVSRRHGVTLPKLAASLGLGLLAVVAAGAAPAAAATDAVDADVNWIEWC
jgi:hypothetical protein